MVVRPRHGAMTSSGRYHSCEPHTEKEPGLSSEGLSEDPKVYRKRLNEQPDEQIDTWMIEFMRDMSIRRGVIAVLAEYRKATGFDNTAIEHRFSR